MNFSKQSWHYKIYSWYTNREPITVNLCPYFRTVFLYAPIKFLFVGWLWNIPFAAIFWPPILFEIPRWAGMVSYGLKMLIFVIYVVAGAMSVSLGAAAGIALLASWYKDYRMNRFIESLSAGELYDYNTYGYLPSRYNESLKDKIGRLLDYIESTLVFQYIKAIHNKVCPVIRFE